MSRRRVVHDERVEAYRQVAPRAFGEQSWIVQCLAVRAGRKPLLSNHAADDVQDFLGRRKADAAGCANSGNRTVPYSPPSTFRKWLPPAAWLELRFPSRTIRVTRSETDLPAPDELLVIADRLLPGYESDAPVEH